jgi:Tfp pilus assembly protein PilZ
MNRRSSPRSFRRLSVRFGRKGETQTFSGQTTDLSTGGMFVLTPHPFPSGTRVRVEIGEGARGFVIEGVVAHAHRLAPELRALGRSGMGIRFLTIEELLTEAVPELGRSGGRPEVPPKDGVYPVRFDSLETFSAAVRNDVRHGGLFVPTRYPAPVATTVTLEIHPPKGQPPLRLRAQVVHSVPATGLEERVNLLAGMGVQFEEADAARAALGALADQLEAHRK